MVAGLLISLQIDNRQIDNPNLQIDNRKIDNLNFFFLTYFLTDKMYNLNLINAYIMIPNIHFFQNN